MRGYSPTWRGQQRHLKGASIDLELISRNRFVRMINVEMDKESQRLLCPGCGTRKAESKKGASGRNYAIERGQRAFRHVQSAREAEHVSPQAFDDLLTGQPPAPRRGRAPRGGRHRQTRGRRAPTLASKPVLLAGTKKLANGLTICGWTAGARESLHCLATCCLAHP